MLNSAVIEVRQHLCCANVFIKFQQPATDLESIKIIVDESIVKLQDPKCSAKIFVNKFFKILPESLSNLTVDANNASFRICVKDIQSSEIDENANRDFLQINLTEQDEASVMCSNCNATLVTSQKYDKIREFPSGAMDVSEFFCHHGPNFKDVLVPSKTNLFYGFQFIVINRTNIQKSTREKENHIYCRRCLRYFGETMLNDRAAKVWCDSIRLGLKGEIMEVFCADNKSDIYKLMVKIIDETSLPSYEPLLRNMHFTKVLLEATFPNRQQQYLLLHILEKHLPILRYKEFLPSGAGSAIHDSTNIELKHNKSFKTLYRLIVKDDTNDKKTKKTWPPILEYWQENINILKMKISPFLFSALNKEMDTNIAVLPEIYRRTTDDFALSYIFY